MPGTAGSLHIQTERPQLEIQGGAGSPGVLPIAQCLETKVGRTRSIRPALANTHCTIDEQDTGKAGEVT